MKTLQVIWPGEKAICFHFKLLLIYLHYEGRAQVNEVGVTDMRKENVGKPSWINFPKMVKPGFPDIVNILTQISRRSHPVVVIFKMIAIEEFDVLHRMKFVVKIKNGQAWKPLIFINGSLKRHCFWV